MRIGELIVCVGTDVLVPVSAPGADGQPQHALARATAAAPVHLLSYSEESGMGRILRDVQGQALERCPAQAVFKANLASVLHTMALDGRGMAWLPQTLIAEDLAADRLVEAAPPSWRTVMEIRLYRDRLPLGRAAEEFWRAVSTVIPPL